MSAQQSPTSGPACSRRILAALPLAVILGVMLGCKASPELGSRPRIGKGAQEYQQLTEESLQAMQKMLGWLDRLRAQTNGCSSKLVASFSRDVEQLQINSVKVRSRAQAIRARGTAYFEAWSENPSSARKLAAYLPEMEEAFGKIKSATQEAGGAFRPFLSGVRKLSVQLQQNPGALQTNEGKELIRRTHDLGSQVVTRLDTLRQELRAVLPLLARAKSAENL